MIKKIIVCVVFISFIFLITGCSKKEADFKLQIKESSWSGWSADYKPKETVKEYDVILGKEYNVDSGNFVFKIIKINNDSIIIKTKEEFSDKEDGIDLRTEKKKFKVSLDKEIKLVTPTIDAGDIYYLKLVK